MDFDSDRAAERLEMLADQVREKFGLTSDRSAAKKIGVDGDVISKARSRTKNVVGTGIVMQVCVELSISPLWFYDPELPGDAVYTDYVAIPPALGGDPVTMSGVRDANPPPPRLGSGTAVPRALREFIGGEESYESRPAHVRKTIEAMRFVGCEPTAATYEQIAATVARTTVVRRARSG